MDSQFFQQYISRKRLSHKVYLAGRYLKFITFQMIIAGMQAWLWIGDGLLILIPSKISSLLRFSLLILEAARRLKGDGNVDRYHIYSQACIPVILIWNVIDFTLWSGWVFFMNSPSFSLFGHFLKLANDWRNMWINKINHTHPTVYIIKPDAVYTTI